MSMRSRAVICAMAAWLSITNALAQQPQSQPAQGGGAVTATAARLAGDQKRTRLIVDLHGEVTGFAFSTSTLADPYRVIVDLPQIDFKIPPAVGQQGRGLVRAYRFGLIAPAKSRIVLDTSDPVAVDKSFLLDAIDDQPARLVIDLVQTGRQEFLQAMATRKPAVKVPDVTTQLRSTQLPANESRLPVVVIDPGHGGIDAGAASTSGEQEKTIVLEFCRALANKINATGLYRAVLTREGDNFITLSGRIGFARANKAALFISIHADTLHDPFGVRGATVYTLSDRASDAASAHLAEKENRADTIAGVDLAAEPDEVADVLLDLTRRETRVFSNRFAKILINQLQTAASLNKNPHRSAQFMVLTASDIPSVLIELGYLSNRDDLKLLTSENWRNRTADAVVAAIVIFFAQ